MGNLKLYMLLAAVMFAWGMNLPALKYLTAQMGPVTMTSLRIFIAGITVFSILYFARLIRKPTRREWGFIIGGAMLNVVMHHYFISVGLSLTSGTNAGLILGTGPIMTAVFGLLLMRLMPTILQWLGLVLGLAGVSAAVLAGNAEAIQVSSGDVLVLFAIIAQVLSFLVISKASKTLDPRLLTAYMFLIGSFGLLVISFFQEPGEWKAFGEMGGLFWVLLFGSAVIATAVGHMSYNFSVGQIGPSKAAVFMNLNTIFGLLGASFFLGEQLMLAHLIGLILIVAGVIFGSGAAEELWGSRKGKRNTI